MSYEKVVVGRLANVATQVADLLQPVGGVSTSGTVANIRNPLAGARMWNSMAAIVNVAGMSGTWTVELQGTVQGVTGLPLMRRASLTAAGRTTLQNLCNSPCIPQPTHVLWDTTAGGGAGVTATVDAVAKQYRGRIPGARLNSTDVVEAILASTNGNVPGSGANGITGADKLHTLSPNSTTANPSVFGGLDRYNMWDAACYFADVTGISGTYIIDVMGTIGGVTVSIATSPSLTGVTKVALTNNFFGCSPRPTHIHYDYVSGGGAGLTCRVIAMAKSHRGQRHKI